MISISGSLIWWTNPDGTVLNFGEVRRAQLDKCSLLTSRLVSLGPFRSFKVCWDAKERVGRGKQGKLPRLFTFSKTATLVHGMRWKTCFWAELQPWCLSLQWNTCPWAEHSDDNIKKSLCKNSSVIIHLN